MRKLIVLFTCFQFSSALFSQDLRAAYLQHKWVSGNTYNFELKLYTEASKNISRPTATINFGDATGGNMTLFKTVTDNGVSVKTYSVSHTYSGIGQYYPVFQDTFRIANIKNIANSQAQPLTSECHINLGTLTGHNTAPFLQKHPIYFKLNNNEVCYEPDFYDADGDSIDYFLANCCTVGYYTPAGTVLSYSGTLCFSKDSLGLYAFSCMVREWRKDAGNNYFIIAYSQLDYVMNITNDVTITEMYKKSAFVLFPNPVTDVLTVNAGPNNCGIEILNMLGQSILKISYGNKINVSHLQPGTYFIKINSSYSKFVKE